MELCKCLSSGSTTTPSKTKGMCTKPCALSTLEHSNILNPESAEAHKVVPLLGKNIMRALLTSCTLHDQGVSIVEVEELNTHSV